MKRLSYVTSQLAAAAILWRHNFCAALRAFSSHFLLLGAFHVDHNVHQSASASRNDYSPAEATLASCCRLFSNICNGMSMGLPCARVYIRLRWTVSIWIQYASKVQAQHTGKCAPSQQFVATLNTLWPGAGFSKLHMSCVAVNWFRNWATNFVMG